MIFLIEPPALRVRDAEVGICPALRRWELRPGRGDHLLDWKVAPRPTWAEGATEIKKALVGAVVLGEHAAVPSRHGVQEGTVLEALVGQGLPAPAVIYRLVLVEIAN